MFLVAVRMVVGSGRELCSVGANTVSELDLGGEGGRGAEVGGGRAL
jgi:hypothetical protein